MTQEDFPPRRAPSAGDSPLTPRSPRPGWEAWGSSGCSVLCLYDNLDTPSLALSTHTGMWPPRAILEQRYR